MNGARTPPRQYVAPVLRTTTLARALWAVCLATLVAAPSAAAAPDLWPPREGPGSLFVHYGEEHWNDDDGERILPKVVADTIRYRPALVTMSGDKANNGTVEQLTRWREIMTPYDAAGIPYFAAVGNHDRTSPPGVPGGLSPVADLGTYRQVFADRPYPFGDAAPPADPRFSPRARPPEDPDGASSHYAFDYGDARWIVIDNSCYSILDCDPLQSPPFPDAEGNTGQYDFLRRRAAEADARGMLVFVVMHMPTQDDRPGHTQPTPLPHTMGEGSSPDNAIFEQVAATAGVDGVFLGHIKGQWLYRAQGVPYYTDGGAGGEVYVNPGEEVGVDTGYWHGYRLVRVSGGRVETDAVPVFVPGGITVSGPASVATGSSARFSATGRQPTEEGPHVEALELREPDRSRSNGETLPAPARIWTTDDPGVLAPVAASPDDPRRDPRTQTNSGAFRGVCPGRTSVTITSGVSSRARAVTVASRPGAIVRSIAAGARRVRPGTSATVATARLRQPAQVGSRVTRDGRLVRTLRARACFAGGSLALRWNGRDARGRAVARGTYTVEGAVRSDRRPVVRRFAVRVGSTRAPGRRPAFTG